jgi:tRNA(Ile)-lysidine synthetase-like protein
MMDKIIENLPRNGVLLAVSGGADSMALLHMLKNHSNIQVAHVNHGIRSDSIEDQRLVENVCAMYNIKCHVKVLSNPPKTGIEEWARNNRYMFLNLIAKTHNIPWIATAHNANDQAETIIMRVIRGTGIKGLRGIHRVVGNIIRPMLDLTKAEVYEYCKMNNVLFREDYTNKDTKYFRNKVRHTMMDGVNIKQLCRIADHAQKSYPKLLLLLNKKYLPYINKTETTITIDRCVPINDLTFILFNELLNEWDIELTESMYDRIKSTDPCNRIIQLNKSIFCNKKKLKYITFNRCKLD